MMPMRKFYIVLALVLPLVVVAQDSAPAPM